MNVITLHMTSVIYCEEIHKIQQKKQTSHLEMSAISPVRFDSRADIGLADFIMARMPYCLAVLY